MTSPDALERALAEALGPDAASRAGDAEMLARMIDGAMSAPPPPIAKAPFIAGGAGAIVIAAALAIWPHAPTESEPAPIATPEIAIVSVRAPVTLETPSVASPIVETKEEIDAAGLFKRANEERRSNRHASAIADYRALQERFSGSPEARASFVALGRLLLDQRADFTGALEQFDRYLEKPGPLEDEALIGRAHALEHLGRRSEADRAWHAILDRHPDSIYAGEARSRIESLAR